MGYTKNIDANVEILKDLYIRKDGNNTYGNLTVEGGATLDGVVDLKKSSIGFSPEESTARLLCIDESNTGLTYGALCKHPLTFWFVNQNSETIVFDNDIACQAGWSEVPINYQDSSANISFGGFPTSAIYEFNCDLTTLLGVLAQMQPNTQKSLPMFLPDHENYLMILTESFTFYNNLRYVLFRTTSIDFFLPSHCEYKYEVDLTTGSTTILVDFDSFKIDLDMGGGTVLNKEFALHVEYVLDATNVSLPLDAISVLKCIS